MFQNFSFKLSVKAIQPGMIAVRSIDLWLVIRANDFGYVVKPPMESLSGRAICAIDSFFSLLRLERAVLKIYLDLELCEVK